MNAVDKVGVKNLLPQFLKTGMTQNSIAINEEILDFGFWILRNSYWSSFINVGFPVRAASRREGLARQDRILD